MFESVIMLLIYLCLAAILFYIVTYVLGVIGIPIPPKVMQLLWVILALVVILLVYRTISPQLGHLGSRADLAAPIALMLA